MSPTDYRTVLSEDQRLVILQTLADRNACPNNTAHEHQLRTALAAAGHRLAADVVRSHLTWLDERPAPLIVCAPGRVWLATLTLRGADVAAGRAHEPGVGGLLQ